MANVSTGDALSQLLATLKDFRAAWPARGWSWDRRVSCVSSSFVVELESKARAVALATLANEWTPGTVGRAPPALREIAERTGGMRPGQLMFSTTGAGPGFAFALWWPWGDGMTTSLRIGLGGTFGSESSLQKLRDVFGVEA